MVAPSADIIQWLLTYKYLLLFPIVVVEGPFVTVLCGFLASIGEIDMLLAYAIIVIADVTGDSLYYAFAKFGGRMWVKRWGHYVGITPARVESLEKHFKNNPGKTLVFGKVAHGLGGPVLVAAGLSNMPYAKFLLINVLASIPKSLLLILLGFYFGHGYQRITQYLDSVAIFFLAAGVVTVLLYIFLPKIIRFFLKGKKF